ncbi:uncharacterized protein LOC117791861 [Drosophila innubila]|uniref:uncharacterized protein LOC117791861 n=1 Tax=Drosophila innubila TaxID=198719 RepID=UPI00148BA319|nr:uncharacterized protein LOC117791861 [Drosophila innubila]
MCEQKMYILKVTLLLIFGHFISATKYQFVPVNDDIFSDCPNKPNSTLKLNKFVDLSKMRFDGNADKIMISGNATIVWNIQKTDRISLTTATYRYDRGQWYYGLLSNTDPDICGALFDTRRLLYMYLGKFIVNKSEIKDKCFNVPGTQIVIEPFEVNMVFEYPGLPVYGLFKMELTLKAYDKQNKQVPNSVCTEIIGELIRIS